MKRLLLFIFVLLGSLTVKGQTFTFQCICDYVTAADSNCDICNTNIQSRLFKGILIKKNGTAFKWIDQPYIVQFQGNNATFKELIPNGETITITLAGTPFDSIPQYQDSIKCPCAGSSNFFIAGPGIYFSGDTISAFDISPINELQTVDSFYISAGNLYVSLDRDSVPASFVTLPVPTGAETIINAGTGISVTGSGTIGSPYVVTNTLPDQTVSITGAGINVVTGTYPNFTVTGTEVGTVASVGLALPTSVFDISGSPVTSTGTLTATFDNQSANTVFAGPTTGGAATPSFRALVAADITTGGGVVGTGVVNQIPYFSPNTTTITTEAGTTTNSLAWDATNNRLGLRDFAPSADFTISNSNSGITGGIRLYEGTDAADYWNIWTGGGGNYDGYLNFTNKNTFIMNMDASGTQFFKGLFMNENNGTSITNVLIRPIQHGNSYISFERLSGVDGALKMAAWGHLNFLTGSNSNAANVDVNGQWGFNMANGSQGRTVDINGEVRIRDLVTTTPTLLVSSDANGVLSTAGLSGLSFSAGTLTATDGSTTNELQTIANTSDATSHTVTLSNSGGSVQLVEGSGVTLTTTGTSGAGVVTIAATGAGTDLTFSGASSPVTLNSSTGTDVTITAGTGISLAATGTDLTINNTGAAALSGVVNQVPYFNTSTTITTEAGSGANSLTWDATNNRLGVGVASPGQSLDVNGIISSQGSVREFRFEYSFARLATYDPGSGSFGGGYNYNWNAENPIHDSNGAASGYAYKSDGSLRLYADGTQTAGTSVPARLTILPSGNTGIGTTSPAQTLHVAGTARITGSDGTATTVMGRDGDGDISALSLSGMSISAGTLTATDGSTTNELQTYGHAGTTTYTNTLSSGGGSWSITGAGIAAISQTAGAITVTATEVDGSVTNEAQTLSTSGTTSGILTLSTAGGAGGGTATIAAGTGISVAQSGGTITITNTSSAGYVNGGNSFGGNATIGLNDNFRWDFEQNNTVRGGINTNGSWYIGSTSLSTAQLNINTLGSTGTGMLISGGGSLVGPNFYTATGSGSGSTATVLSGVLSMLSGNVESIMKNTTTAGTGGGALFTVNVSPTATSNDPFFKWQTDGVTDWSMGIDNSDGDNLKLHRFSRPSDNDGQGTIELGYRTNDIGIAINKTGIGITTNGFYGIDVGGKVRTDQYVNNSLNLSGAAFATIAVGTAAGTSPTVDGVVTSVWGNGAHLKFTSGSSPTANGVICTVTLDTQYTFTDCVPIMQGRSTNAGAFNYSCSYNSGTRVITCTLVGTLTASTVYEFNLLFFGRN